MSFIPKQELFTVESRRAFFASGDNKSRIRSHGHNMLVSVDQDGQELLINRNVSDNYHIHQPNEIIESFSKVIDEAGLEINNYFLNPANGGLMISAKYQGLKIIGDDTDFNIVMFCSHDGKSRTFLTLQALRIACMNQAPVLAKEKQRHLFSEKHFQHSLDSTVFENILLQIPHSVNAYNARTEQLADTKMSQSDFVEFFTNHMGYDKEQKQYDTKIAQALEAYNHNDNASIPINTAYRAFHAVTMLNTRNIKRTVYQNENRLIKGQANSQKAMDSLLRLAA